MRRSAPNARNRCATFGGGFNDDLMYTTARNECVCLRVAAPGTCAARIEPPEQTRSAAE